MAWQRRRPDPLVEGDPPPHRRGRPEPSPAQRALGLLVRREHSRKELLAKLIERGIAPDDAAAAVLQMTQSGWQDDRRFAGSLARMRVSHGYGPIRIRAELGTHGLDEGLIESALAELHDAGRDDWRGMAADLIRRRYGEAVEVDMAVRRKAADFLARRGFDSDSVRAALRPANRG